MAEDMYKSTKFHIMAGHNKLDSELNHSSSHHVANVVHALNQNFARGFGAHSCGDEHFHFQFDRYFWQIHALQHNEDLQATRLLFDYQDRA